VITKLDGTAKAGVLFAIARQVAKPVYFIGLGEGIDDLKAFSAEEFVDALLAKD
jgi:fused signal recognition particle receptor